MYNYKNIYLYMYVYYNVYIQYTIIQYYIICRNIMKVFVDYFFGAFAFGYFFEIDYCCNFFYFFIFLFFCGRIVIVLLQVKENCTKKTTK